MYLQDVAIDPLALLLPSRIYVIIAEKQHPHEPALAVLEEAMRDMSAAEKTFVTARARALAEYSRLVEQAAGATK
jgi:hypothetical protein